MDKPEYIKKFQEECYIPAAQNFLNQTLDSITEDAENIHKKLNGQFDSFFQSLCILQERKQLGAIKTICVSFPFTSLSCGSPYLLFQVYPYVPFLDNSLVSMDFSSDWLFKKWNQLSVDLLESAGNLGLGSVIRSPYVKSRTWSAAQVGLRLISTAVKYHLYGLEEMHSYQRLEKAEDFTVTFGEYMGWQRPLFALKEPVDIFQCEEDTDLSFRRFSQAWYENKDFGGFNLEDCIFNDCTFHSCRIKETDFRDARFLGCTFQDCCFENIKLNGTRFDGCKFEGVSMSNIVVSDSADGILRNDIMYGEVEFIGCFLRDTSISGCDLSAGSFRDCRMQDVKTQECILPEEFGDYLA